MYVSLRLNKGTYNKWLIPSNNNDNDGRRERELTHAFFYPKNLLWESLSCCSAACSNYCQKKKKKNETNPHLQKGASLRMKMKALLQSSVPYPTGDPLEKLSSSTPFYPQCRVTWVLSKCIKICQNASKCIKMYQDVSKYIQMY